MTKKLIGRSSIVMPRQMKNLLPILKWCLWVTLLPTTGLVMTWNFSRKIIKGNNIAGLVGYIADGVGVLTFQIAISVLLALFFKPVYGIIAAFIFAVIKIVMWRVSLKVDNLFFRKIDNVRPVKKILEHFLVSENIAECFKE